jgi:hypothetical protein
MATMAATKTWKNAVETFISTRRDSTNRVVGETLTLIDGALPALRLAEMDYVTRSRRVSVASIVARCAREAAPGGDVAKLRRLLDEHPARFKHTMGALHILVERIRTMPGLAITPPVDEDGILLAISSDAEGRSRVSVELGRVGFNPVTLQGVAFMVAGERFPENFGSVDIEVEAREITDALAHVAAIETALRSQPELLAAVASHFGVRTDARQILRAAAARSR